MGKKVLLFMFCIFLNRISTTLNMKPKTWKFLTNKLHCVSPEQIAQLPTTLAVRWESDCYIIWWMSADCIQSLHLLGLKQICNKLNIPKTKDKILNIQKLYYCKIQQNSKYHNYQFQKLYT